MRDGAQRIGGTSSKPLFDDDAVLQQVARDQQRFLDAFAHVEPIFGRAIEPAEVLQALHELADLVQTFGAVLREPDDFVDGLDERGGIDALGQPLHRVATSGDCAPRSPTSGRGATR